MVKNIGEIPGEKLDKVDYTEMPGKGVYLRFKTLSGFWGMLLSKKLVMQNARHH